MSALDRLRFPLVVFLAVVVQTSAAASVYVAGVHPDFLLLLVVATAMVGGPMVGMAAGFAVGLLTDLVVDTPFGLSILTDVLVGYGLGTVWNDAGRLGRWVVPPFAAAASAAGVIAYAAIGDLIGQSQMPRDHLISTVLVVAALNGVLILPARAVVGWSLPERVVRAQETGR